MKNPRLVKTQKFSDGNICNTYKCDDFSVYTCEEIYNLKGLCIEDAMANIEGEEMQPDIRCEVKSFNEILELTKVNEVSYCQFDGSYNGEFAGFLVELDSDAVKIEVKDIKVAESIIKALEG